MAINISGISQDIGTSIGLNLVSNALSGFSFPYTLAATYGMNAPAGDWRYRVILPKFSSIGNSSGLEGTYSGWKSQLDEESSDMGIYVEGIDIPQINVSPSPRKFCGRDINFPGRVNVESFTIKFYEDRKYTTTNYLQLWRQLVVNDNGDYGLPVDYKKIIQVYAYDEANLKHILFRIHGCYPEKPSGYSYSGSTSGRVIVNCSFSCDWVSIERQNRFI